MNFVEDFPRIANAMRLPGVGADEDNDYGILNIFGRMTILFAIKPSINPEATGLLLSQGVVIILRAHRCANPFRIRATEVIALSATAKESQGVPAIGIAQVNQFGGNFGDSLIPGDLFKRPINSTSQRGG